MTLREYQLPHFTQLFEALRANGAALDASDTGTGKTYVALAICKALNLVPLVIGPKAARGGWEAAAADAGLNIEFVNYERVRGKRKQRPDGTRVTDNDWIQEQPWGNGSFIKWKHAYSLIIFDEAHRCGGATSLNSKLMIAAKRQAELVLALSATAADDPRQMKALGYLLDLHGLSKRGSRTRLNYMSWLFRHGCTPGVFGGFDFTADRQKQSKAFVKLHQEIFPARGARMRKTEIPGFPQTTIDVLPFYDESQKAEAEAERLHESGDTAASMQSRRKLELLKVPYLIDAAIDYGRSSRVVIFVNFTDPLFQIYEALGAKLGRVGYISGEQTGKQGEIERRKFLDDFQVDKLAALVCNSQAGGESVNMHDPTGRVERTTLISPPESGRQFRQIVGRVNRDGGARSLQLLAYFKGTCEEVVAKRVRQKCVNIDLLNDADFIV